MTEPTAEGCPVCGDLPGHVVVRTGQGESVPAGAARLEEVVRLAAPAQWTAVTGRKLLRCRHCRCLFDWQDEPQYMGSGNLDEERYTRFPLNESKIAGDFLDGKLADPNEIFEVLSKDLLWLVLDACVQEPMPEDRRETRLRSGLYIVEDFPPSRDFTAPIRGVIPGIVEHMIHHDRDLFDVLSKLVNNAPSTTAAVLATLDRTAKVPDEARELVENCKSNLRGKLGIEKQ